MTGLFLICCAYIAWVIWYQKKWYLPEDERAVGSWGIRQVLQFAGTFIFWILMYSVISRTFVLPKTNAPDSGVPGAPDAHPQAATFLFWTTIAALGLLIFVVFNHELGRIIKARARDPFWQAFFRALWGFVLACLIIFQLTAKNVVTNNIFAFTIAWITVDLAVRLRRSSLFLIMLFIAILDVWMVWLSGNAMMGNGQVADPEKASFLIKLIRSDFMQHFPYPLGIFWGGRMLGCGDLLFGGIVVGFAARTMSVRAAVIAGLAMFAPLLVLSYAQEWFHLKQIAWPYTIFIAPVGMIVAAASGSAIRVPEEWKKLGDDNGPEVIGNPDKDKPQ